MVVNSGLYLIYHEVYPYHSPYLYSLSVEKLDAHLRVAEELNSNSKPDTHQIKFTFDDGHVTHFEQALPLLEKHGMKGLFFVTAGWIGSRTGFMSWSQVRELAKLGHQVQAHGFSHRFLTSCSPDELRTELLVAKTTLEQRVGVQVDAMSIPGGRWDAHIVRECAKFGFSRVFTSDPFLRRSFPTVQLIGRININNDFEPARLRELRDPHSLLALSYATKHLLKAGTRRTLGDQLYHRLWRWWTDQHSNS